MSEFTDRVFQPFWEEGYDGNWYIALPHQCDSWEIGSVSDVDVLIGRLRLLVSLGAPPSDARYEWKPLDQE